MDLYAFLQNSPTSFIDYNGLFKFKMPELRIPFDFIAVSGLLKINGDVDVDLRLNVDHSDCEDSRMDAIQVSGDVSKVSEKNRWGFDVSVKAWNSVSSLTVGYRAGVQIPSGKLFGSESLQQFAKGYYWNEGYNEGKFVTQRWFRKLRFQGKEVECVCAMVSLSATADAELRWHPANTAALAGAAIAAEITAPKIAAELLRWWEILKKYPEMMPAP